MFYFSLLLYIFLRHSHAAPILAIVTGSLICDAILTPRPRRPQCTCVGCPSIGAGSLVSPPSDSFGCQVDSELTPRLLLSQILFMVELKPLLTVC